MDLREAYRILELAPGANEDAVRDARKLLAKVWHPDRHANDPELAKKAAAKLAEINTAFEAIRAAKFPTTLEPAPVARPAKPRPATGPITPKRARAEPAPAKPKPPKAPKPPSPPKEDRDLLPRRRVRAWVVVVLAAGLGIGAYFAIVKLGTRAPATSQDAPAPLPVADAAVASNDDPIADAAESAVEPDGPEAVSIDAPDGPTYGLGATRGEVRAVEGEPDHVVKVTDEEWAYGFSLVVFDRAGKVKGWWDRDDRLHTRLAPRDPVVAAKAVAAGSFGKGSTKDEVIALQGTPNRISTTFGETWSYGHSDVAFDARGKVKAWRTFDIPLKAK